MLKTRDCLRAHEGFYEEETFFKNERGNNWKNFSSHFTRECQRREREIGILMGLNVNMNLTAFCDLKNIYIQY